VAAEMDGVGEDHQPENADKNRREDRGVSSPDTHRPSCRYAAIYARVSTEDQGKGYSIAREDWAARVLSYTGCGFVVAPIGQISEW
jgi:hypothetical protein